MKNTQPVQLTTEEASKLFVQHTAGLLEYWLTEPRATTTKEKMEGLVHSIFAVIDGCSVTVPGFKMVPNIAEEDGLNFMGTAWPNEDITGGLHDLWHGELLKSPQERTLLVEAVARFEKEMANFKEMS